MTPEVIEGYRGPRSERRADPQSRPGPQTIKPGKVTIQFTKARYRVQLTAPEELTRSDGTKVRAKALVVVADEYLATFDEVKDKDVIQRLRDHPSYGTDFWDFKDVLEKAKEARRAEAIKVLQNPEDRAAIIEALRASGEESFTLPRVPVSTPAAE